jgi:hypothetical protein
MYVKQKSQGSPLLDDVVYLFNSRFKKINKNKINNQHTQIHVTYRMTITGEREREERKERMCF